MPYVKIEITREGNVTPEKKLALIQGATDLLVKVLDKDPSHTFVVIDEIDTDNWGVGYESVTQLRRRSQ
jgi:4-oxalocrotonate tautomerase